jgi:hypothetical protein
LTDANVATSPLAARIGCVERVASFICKR